jgi:hypothetical protein
MRRAKTLDSRGGSAVAYLARKLHDFAAGEGKTRLRRTKTTHTATMLYEMIGVVCLRLHSSGDGER